MQNNFALASPFTGRPFYSRGGADPYALDGVGPTFLMDVAGGQYKANGVTTTLEAMTVSARTTPQTCIDSDGVLKWGLHNLLKWSNDLTQSGTWGLIGTPVTASVAIATPLGTIATTVEDNSASAFEGVGQNATIPADSAKYVLEAYVLKTTGSTSPTFGFNYKLTGGTAVDGSLRIDTDTGAVNSGTAVLVGAWWHVKVSVTNNGTNTILQTQAYPATGVNGSFTDVASATGTVTLASLRAYRSDLGGMQLATDGSTYIETTTAPVYAATRTLIGGKMHSREWEGRTNLLVYSNDFTNASWVKDGMTPPTVTSNYAVGPDGVTGSASRVYFPENLSRIWQVGTSATTNTFVVWLKSNTGSTISNVRIFLREAGFSTVYAQKNINVTTAWERFEVTGDCSSSAFGVMGMVYNSATGGGNNWDLQVYGASFEAGSSASPYIPTTTAAVSRGADDIQGVQAGDGTELVTNGTFDSGSTGWTVIGEDSTHIATFSASSVRYQSDTTTPALNVKNADAALVIGRYYEIVVTTSSHTSGSLKTDSLTGSPIVSSGVGEVVLRGTAQQSVFSFLRATANVDITIDNVSVQQLLPFAGYDQTKGTMVVDFAASDTNNQSAWALSDGTSSNFMRQYNNLNNIRFHTVDGGTTQANIVAAGGFTADTNYRLATAYTANDFSASVNGAAVVTDTLGTVPSVTEVHIGADETGINGILNGEISYLAYYPARISDAPLVTESGK